MKTLTIGILLLLTCLEEMQAQDSPFENLALSTLFDKRVQTELELSESQKSKIDKILKSVLEWRNDYVKEYRELAEAGLPADKAAKKQKELQDTIELKKGEYQKEALDILLPHQVKRLRQLTVQAMMPQIAKQQKTKSGLLTKEMMAFLEIDAEQKNKILQKTEQLQRELLEEMKELQAKYTDKLLDELTPSQRKKYTDAIGEKVEGLNRPAKRRSNSPPENSGKNAKRSIEK